MANVTVVEPNVPYPIPGDWPSSGAGTRAVSASTLPPASAIVGIPCQKCGLGVLDLCRYIWPFDSPSLRNDCWDCPAEEHLHVSCRICGVTVRSQVAAPTTGQPPTQTVQSIAVTPATPMVPAGSTVQMTATATYSNQTTGDVTHTATWTVTGQPIPGTINSSGLFTGTASGNSGNIIATVGTVQGMASVYVS